MPQKKSHDFSLSLLTIMSSAKDVFTVTSAASLAGVAALYVVGSLASNALLPKNAPFINRFTFIWLAFDGLTHLTIEASFLYLSTFGRTVNSSVGPLADMWREYVAADFRWGVADPTVVSLEILTVLGAGPLCFYILKQLISDDPARHYWIVVLSTAELYGGWMTFCPEWLTSNRNLDTSNVLFFWVYLVFLNILWVVIPIGLMVHSYGEIAKSLRASQTAAKAKKA
ncbi:Emopamil-binding protein [Mycena amicta]|nr:Emopamil-binding protein [Mycena amicta]